MAETNELKVAAPGTYFVAVKICPPTKIDNVAIRARRYIVRVVCVFADGKFDGSAEYNYLCEFPFNPEMLPRIFKADSLIRPDEDDWAVIQKLLSSSADSRIIPEDNVKNDVEKEFEVGDIVCLKSGGPTMCVNNVILQGIVCMWMDEDNRINTATFDRRCLKAY